MENRFRTVEISDPAFERDHLRFITVKTDHLKGRGDVCVFTPPVNQNVADLPVVILLHGVYGSAWSWPLKSGIHLQAMKWINEGSIPPMVIAMPSDGLWGDGSGYVPHNGFDFEKWIAEDIPCLLKEHIEGVTGNSPFFISGLSMGGFGALKIGVKYHHVFQAAGAHSSITEIGQMKIFVEEELSEYLQADMKDEDVLSTILAHRENIIPFRFDCGMNDMLIEQNRELHRQLEHHSIPHEYAEHPGEHEWTYWKEHIKDSFFFFARHLKIKKS